MPWYRLLVSREKPCHVGKPDLDRAPRWYKVPDEPPYVGDVAQNGSKGDLMALKFDFRSAPESELKSVTAPCPKRAKSGSSQVTGEQVRPTAAAIDDAEVRSATGERETCERIL
jgi:hypothetical protein